MSFRLRLLALLLTFALALPFVGHAQQPAPSGGAVHGLVVDPDGALVPSATVTFATSAGKTQETTSKTDGTYTMRGIAPGTYTVTVTAPGFAPYVKEGVRVATGANVTLDAKLALAEENQQVTVTADAVNLSVDPESNASSTTISGDALQALSDDPDELQSELQALAGPAAGPEGGQIYIDGFTGGQLPPKSSILAIRVNSNPFSAQYDRLGYGRIEIITKPGTDKYHGQGSIQFSDKIFNTSTPFLGSSGQPDYHTIFGFGSVTGPIKTGMSYTLNGSYRDISNNNIINPTALYANPSNPTVMCQPGDPTCSSLPYPTANRAAPAPQTRWDISPRLDMLLGPKNTLTTRFQYESGSSTSNGSGNSLPSLGSTSTSSEITLQMSDTQLLSDKVINETRFEYQRSTSASTPVNTGTGVVVQGVVNAFGSGGGGNNTVQSHIEIQNYTSIQLAKNFIRIGGRLRSTGETVTSLGGQSGLINYSYLLDPCTDPSIAGSQKSSLGCNSTSTPCAGSSAGTRISSYQCNLPFEFDITSIKQGTIQARQTDFEPYIEDDWKVRPNLTWSYGVRLETQNYINSTHDFAPRTSIAFGVPRKNGKTTTVIRAGFGIFYNRFNLSQIAAIIQGNPSNQQTIAYSNPGTTIAPCSPSAVVNCTSGGASTGITQKPESAGNIRSGYMIQSAATLEQQVGKFTSLSVTYLNTHGEHQFLNRVFPSGFNYCGDNSAPGNYVNCYQSEGVFRQNQINVNVNTRTTKGINLFGFYSLGWANSNIANITNPFNPAYDYGRAGFDVRNRMAAGGTIPLPFLITVSPFLLAQSGSPYNITTGQDNNLDFVKDDRPQFASGVTASNANCRTAASFLAPSKGSSFVAGEPYAEIPVNFCTGPANMSFNLRLSRTFGFGPLTEAARARNAASQQGGGPGAPGGFGGIGGGGGRGGGRGGPGGGPGGGGSGSNTGHKYNLTLGAQAFNLFNQVPYGTPVSTLSSNLFGQYTQLAGGGGQGGGGGGGGGGGSPFASANAVRRITFQLNFSF